MGSSSSRSGAEVVLGLDPAAAHARVAASFTDRVRSVPPERWDDPSPVAGWTARDVVGHLVTWLPGFLGGGGVELLRDPDAPEVSEDPAGAWAAHRDAVQALLDDPERSRQLLENPHVGTLPAGEAVDRFYTADVFMHTWDLARATGQDETLDPALCQELYDGMLPIQPLLESSGQYGPPVPVPEGSDPQTRLLGLIGRSP
jgi:uncharacterized protein (TIGR03086 family)